MLFSVLNTSLFQDGAYIKISDTFSAKDPILIFYFTHSNAQSHTRNYVFVDKNSKCSIIEYHISLDSVRNFSNNVTELILEPSSSLEYCKLQVDNVNSYYIGNTYVSMSSNSYFEHVNICMEGSIVRNNLNITIDGTGCRANAKGLYIPKKGVHIDNFISINHNEPDSNSYQLYKGIILEKGEGVFNGGIKVDSKAQKTNAFQSNRNILLSPDVSINVKPQLKIWAE